MATRIPAHARSARGRPTAVLSALVLMLALSGCDDDGSAPVTPMHGTADLSSYVAIGNSATMGVLDGALLQTGSSCSYPALLAGQAELVDFEIPLFSDPGIVAFPPNEVGVVDGGRMVVSQLSPLVIERAPAGVPLNQDLARPYNNLGVSNALLAEAPAVADQGSSLIGNPLFDLIFRGFGTWDQQAGALAATFITLWLGNNDVLIWAGAGGDDALAPGLPVPVPVFANAYGAMVDRMLAITHDVVLFNLPDLTSLPAFTTIPPVVVDPQTNQAVLNGEGSPIPLLGSDGPLDPGDLVILSASALLLQGIGVPEELGGTGDPLPDAAVLSLDEQAEASAATAGYNEAIRASAMAHGLPTVDVAGLLAEVASVGVAVGTGVLTADYLTGGAFGLDGIHPTCKGYGLIANRLIDVINDEYGASIPPVPVGELEGVLLPAGDAAWTGGVPRFGS